MVVIVGAGTTVTSNLISGGMVSVNFSISPSVERLFELGTSDAFDINIQTQESMSITNYGGASLTVPLAPNFTCDDSTARMDVTIVPAPCTGSTSPIIRTGADAHFITSYSYSKDFQGYGQESWSLQSKPIFVDYTGSIAFLQGFAEGSRLEGTDIVSDDGIVLTGSVPATSFDAQGRTISVTAGFPGTGQDDIQTFGKVTQIGGAVGKEDGKRGQSSATVPHTPVFF